MKSIFFITALFTITFFISCNKADEKSSDLTLHALEINEPEKKPGNDKQQIPVGKFSPLTTDSTVSPAHPAVNTDWDSKIIKTASIKLEIKDFKKYNDFVHSAVKQFGAYVAQEEQSLSDEKSETVITIKVPVAQFETMMNKLPGDDGKVLEKRINTDDVTGEVVDTRSRLEAKKQMRLKYLEFLKQSKNMEEVLQVQNEINSIQIEIESAASRVSFLSQQSAYSAINLTFFQPLAGFKPADESPSFLTRLTAAFKNGAGWFAEFFVGIVAMWPLWLIAFGVYFGWKKVRGSKKVMVQNP